MARWTASAKWAEGPALDGQRDMPLALRLSEGLGVNVRQLYLRCYATTSMYSTWLDGANTTIPSSRIPSR